MKKKKTKKAPKPRHAWAINPKTRIKPSARQYKRAKAKEEQKRLLGEPSQ